MFTIIDINEKEKWREILESSYTFDFYHSYDYHLLSSGQKEGDPKLFLFKKNDEFIAIPLLERKIDFCKGAIDYTSVYGYAGPIVSKNELSESCIKGFQESIDAFFRENNVVSVFSRLHPLVKQNFVLNGLGDIKNLSSTVTIDLGLSLEEQRKQYRKSNKSEINQLRRNVNCKIIEDDSELEKFVGIYYENMDRIHASKEYYFSYEYFKKLLDSKDFKSEIRIATENGNMMAGAMFIYSNNIIQYHLAATSKEYLSCTPMKLILDETRIIGTKEGYRYLHLGGGVGSSDDSLLRFKSGFSKRMDQFNIWKYIVDHDLYRKLVEIHKADIKDFNYFPLYRG